MQFAQFMGGARGQSSRSIGGHGPLRFDGGAFSGWKGRRTGTFGAWR